MTPLLRILFVLLSQCILHDAFLLPQQPSSFVSFNREKRKETTQRCLFFRAREEQRQRISNSYATPERIKQLTSSSLQLPFVINASNDSTITLKKMDIQDLNDIVDLCMEEYGKKNRTNFADQLDQWWLQRLIDSTMRMKLVLDSSVLEKDHTILVATQHTCQQSTPRVIGMIEVSWQPVLPDRIPPAVPIPLPLKRMYCQVTGTPMEAWIGNLLIEPSFRRRGLAKVLVSATEGIAAQRTGCTSLHLHCDAQYSVAQRLYQSMGYRIVPKEDTPFTFDGGMAWKDSIYFVDGVALLYLRKDLS